MNKEDRVLELHERTKRSPLSGELDPGYDNNPLEPSPIDLLNVQTGCITDLSNFPFVQVTDITQAAPITYYYHTEEKTWFKVSLSSMSMLEKLQTEQIRIDNVIKKLERQRDSAIRNNYHDEAATAHFRITDHKNFKEFIDKLIKES